MTEIKLAQEIKAAPSVVFPYLVNQELLAKWLTPAVIAFPKKGTFAAFAFGNNVNFKVEITEMLENKALTWKCIDGNVDWVGSEISFVLNEKNGSTTIVEFSQKIQENSITTDKWKNNWQFYLSTLGEVVQ